MASKSEIRSNTRIFKNQIDQGMADFASEVIGYRVMALDEYKRADRIFVYADYNKEVGTSSIIRDALKNGKKVAVPKVFKENISVNEKAAVYMKFFYITSLDELKEGYKGIREPLEEFTCADSDTKDAIMIMPVVGFDKDRNRVGYGSGCYDRYLATHSFSCLIAIAFDEQKAESVDDVGKDDIRPDMILTEKNIY